MKFPLNLRQKYTSDIFTRFKVTPGILVSNRYVCNGSIILLTEFNWCEIKAQFGIFGVETEIGSDVIESLYARSWTDIMALRVDDLMNPVQYVPFQAMSPYIKGWMSPDEDMQVTTDVLFDEFVKDTYVRNVRI